MIKRTLYFGNPAYLSKKDDQLVIRLIDSGNKKEKIADESAEMEKVDKNDKYRDRTNQNMVPIEDTGIIILDNQQITITQGLLHSLLENNTAVVSCDSSHMPVGLFLPLSVNQIQSERFQAQIESSIPLRKQLWQQTISAKIKNQAALLRMKKVKAENMIKWAKDNQIPVICANPPRKYANAVARQGLKAYKNFPEEPRLYPLPQNLLRDRNSIYESKLKDLFQAHGSHMSVEHTILAQNFWDAGMTEKIASHQLITGRKVLHLNGRFHSDYGLGVAHRLKKSGIRTLTMTLLQEAIKTETERKIADFLIFTNKPILKEDGKSD